MVPIALCTLYFVFYNLLLLFILLHFIIACTFDVGLSYWIPSLTYSVLIYLLRLASMPIFRPWPLPSSCLDLRASASIVLSRLTSLLLLRLNVDPAHHWGGWTNPLSLCPVFNSPPIHSLPSTLNFSTTSVLSSLPFPSRQPFTLSFILPLPFFRCYILEIQLQQIPTFCA